MAQLEQLVPGAVIHGVLPDSQVTVVSVQWFGSEALELTYKTADQLIYRPGKPGLEIVEKRRPWSFDGDGACFGRSLRPTGSGLAHLFDPVLATYTSIVGPLPLQITAVRDAML